MKNKDNIEKENRKEGKKSINKVIPICIFVILAVILILIGVYQLYFANPKRVMTNAITNIADKFEGLLDIQSDALDLDDTYTMTGNVKFDIQSPLLTSLGTSAEYKPYVNIIKNLNKSSNDYTIKQDIKNKKLLAQWNTKLGNTNTLNATYFIQNNRQYIFVKDFFDHYIDGGEIEYFSIMEDNKNSLEDLEYLYDLTISSFKKNLKSSYFKKENTKTIINTKEKDVKQVSLKIDQKNVNEILSNILNELKDDEKANKILTGYNKQFKNSKIDSNKKILDAEDSIILNVYTDKLTYKELKYEIVLKDDKEQFAISYIDDKTDTIEIYKNQKLLGSASIEGTNDQFKVILKDASNKEIGTINATISNTKSNIDINVTIDQTTIAANTNKMIVKDKDHYKIDSVMTFVGSSNGTKLIDMKITNNAILKENAIIDEEVKNAISSDQLTTDQKSKAQTKLYTVLATMMQ